MGEFRGAPKWGGLHHHKQKCDNHTFCKDDDIKRFVRFGLQLKTATEIG